VGAGGSGSPFVSSHNPLVNSVVSRPISAVGVGMGDGTQGDRVGHFSGYGPIKL